jgi:hypothetical protein
MSEIEQVATKLTKKIARREAQKKYNHSEKGKAAKQRYMYTVYPSKFLADPAPHIAIRTQRLIEIFQHELSKIEFNLQRIQSQKTVTEKSGFTRITGTLGFTAIRTELLKYKTKIEQVLEILQ